MNCLPAIRLAGDVDCESAPFESTTRVPTTSRHAARDSRLGDVIGRSSCPRELTALLGGGHSTSIPLSRIVDENRSWPQMRVDILWPFAFELASESETDARC